MLPRIIPTIVRSNSRRFLHIPLRNCCHTLNCYFGVITGRPVMPFQCKLLDDWLFLFFHSIPPWNSSPKHFIGQLVGLNLRTSSRIFWRFTENFSLVSRCLRWTIESDSPLIYVLIRRSIVIFCQNVTISRPSLSSLCPVWLIIY